MALHRSKWEEDVYGLCVLGLHAHDVEEKDRAIRLISQIIDAIWEDRLQALDIEDDREGSK